MKHFFAWVLAILLALTPLSAQGEMLEQTWAQFLNGVPLQDWVDGELAAGAGGAMDSCALCLIRSGADVDLSSYADAAATKLEAGISNASTRQRTALALIACGAADRVPENLVDESAGKLGVMSWVWALHLVCNGAPSALWTADSIVETLLDLQLEDGGWRVSGDRGDVDVTSMCLQALAYCDVESEALKAAIGRGVDFLSAWQLGDGSFASMGNEESAESTAQVIIALTSLGIAPEDERFVKNGHTPLDALMNFYLPSGGFSHLMNGEANLTSTLQALQALISLDLGGTAVYDFRAEEHTPHPTSSLPTWKRWAFIVLGALTLAGIAFALTRQRGRFKQLLFVLLAASAVFAALCFLRIDAAESYYDPSAGSDRPADGHVTISIRCDRVAGRADDGSTPEDGVILPPTEIPFADGDSAFDALVIAARQHSIQLEHEGAGELAYVIGINYLYEYAYGELSGWVYTINGERLSIGCGSYKLHDGDEILWYYTTELGEDLK